MMSSSKRSPTPHERLATQMQAHRERLVPKVGAAQWNAVTHAGKMAMLGWLNPLMRQCRGMALTVPLRLHRGLWVRYIGEPGELQRYVPTGTYGQVVSARYFAVLFDNESAPLTTPPNLLEVVPSPPPRHRRWHLRQCERRWKAIERARAVWGL